MPVQTPVIRTAVYVDGYNLYYGRLRGSPYKWLDVYQLFNNILVARGQNETLVQVKVFTAHALASFASNKAASVAAQSSYHRALTQYHGDRCQVVYGRHTFDRSGTLLPEFIAGQPYDRRRRVRVWKVEEKQTDVNLALHMFIDAWQGRYDRVILASNDSDVAPALQAIRQHFPHIIVGVVPPVRPPQGVDISRRLSGSLANAAHWTLSHLSDSQLENAQLPAMIATRKKPIRKPAHW